MNRTYHGYVGVLKIFADKRCELYTTEEEYNDMIKITSANKCKFTFKASCGHDNTVTLTNFIQKGSGVICKICMKSQVSGKLVEYQKNNDKPAGKGNVQETEGFNKINDMLINDFDVIKTNEGCTADFIIKPKKFNEDKWLGIQLKTTQGICHNLYSFRLHDTKYENMLILCYCISNNSTWLIPFDVVAHIKNNLNIGLTDKSIYNKYKVNEKNTLSIGLLKYFTALKLDILENYLIPKNICQQNEIKYRKIREESCKFLKFEKPEIEQSYYDFTINGKKIQEKVACKRNDRKDTYLVCICRGRSHEDRRQYILGMNDYYWIHIPEIDLFFLFPERELFNNGFIQDPNEEKNTKFFLSLKINIKKSWYHKYQYDYKNLDENIISKLFE